MQNSAQKLHTAGSKDAQTSTAINFVSKIEPELLKLWISFLKRNTAIPVKGRFGNPGEPFRGSYWEIP